MSTAICPKCGKEKKLIGPRCECGEPDGPCSLARAPGSASSGVIDCAGNQVTWTITESGHLVNLSMGGWGEVNFGRDEAIAFREALSAALPHMAFLPNNEVSHGT